MTMHLNGGLSDADYRSDLLASGQHIPELSADYAHCNARPNGRPSRLLGAGIYHGGSRATRTASRRSCARTGSEKNSTAPAFMAFTDIGMSPWPVMKIIGMLICIFASSLGMESAEPWQANITSS